VISPGQLSLFSFGLSFPGSFLRSHAGGDLFRTHSILCCWLGSLLSLLAPVPGPKAVIMAVLAYNSKGLGSLREGGAFNPLS
jgi:hypothetical protein